MAWLSLSTNIHIVTEAGSLYRPFVMLPSMPCAILGGKAWISRFSTGNKEKTNTNQFRHLRPWRFSERRLELHLASASVSQGMMPLCMT